jgi:hypothetical protein
MDMDGWRRSQKPRGRGVSTKDIRKRQAEIINNKL